MNPKVTKWIELGPFRALPTAGHARVALRYPPEPRAVRAAHPHARALLAHREDDERRISRY